jgi:hypothetical protein
MYFYYSHGGDKMVFVELCLRTGMSVGKLIAKALNFTIQKHSFYNVQILWNTIGGNSAHWKSPQFALINKNLNLGLNN